MSVTTREINRRRLTYHTIRHRLIWIALIGTSLMSYAATAGFVVAAMQPVDGGGWVVALVVASIFEALLIVLKSALRDDSRDGLAWGATLLDVSTNTAGVYWWAPGIALAPGIAQAVALAGLDPAGALARTLLSALVGAFLSAAPVWLLPLALRDGEGSR